MQRHVGNHALGSSPRVRGTGLRSGERRSGRRFIPARAGNRAPKAERPTEKQVHPRACGEQATPDRLFAHWRGSSPRVRGTGRIRVVFPDVLRFIPARAGNRDRAADAAFESPVHPRACGEQHRPQLLSHRDSGSSPRVRGTAPDMSVGWHCSRFIPARAGNRAARPSPRAWRSVHPRACGEQQRIVGNIRTHDGSSPRVRGTGEIYDGARFAGRFIPARAGNRRQSPRGKAGHPVHPRACGGTERCHLIEPRRVRFIPARAGNSPSRSFRVG